MSNQNKPVPDKEKQDTRGKKLKIIFRKGVVISGMVATLLLVWQAIGDFSRVDSSTSDEFLRAMQLTTNTSIYEYSNWLGVVRLITALAGLASFIAIFRGKNELRINALMLGVAIVWSFCFIGPNEDWLYYLGFPTLIWWIVVFFLFIWIRKGSAGSNN